MAVGRLKKLSADERTRMIYEAREMAIMDEMARNEAALAKGRAEGETKGRAEGEAKGRAEIAMNMLRDGFTHDVIAKISGMSLEEVNSLKPQVNEFQSL
jgi:predicted transposase/invertase (TIGR01784 family)